MSMAWNRRLKAAWRGEVPDANLSAMFAATSRLTDLHQALEDRRLAAQIEHAEHDWRAPLAVGQIAAPLWLADALVDLAGTFYDAETQAHPDRPSSVSPSTHALVVALLAPVEDIIADVTAALADPGHRTALTAPLRIGPGGDIGNIVLPDPPAVPYARGLATGARHVHTSAATTLVALREAVARSESPDWLAAGMQRLDGELQATGARLDMGEMRLEALLATRSADPGALAAIGRDLWSIVGVAVIAGQQLSDPHLLPEAAAALRHTPAAPAAPAASRTPPAPPVPPVPPSPPAARPPAPVVHVTLPDIEAGAAPLRERQPAPESHPAAPPAEVALPAIGEPAQTPAPSPTPPSSKAQPDAPPSPAAPATEQDDGAPIRFPDIG